MENESFRVVIIGQGDKVSLALVKSDLGAVPIAMNIANEAGAHAIRHAVRMLFEAFEFATGEEAETVGPTTETETKGDDTL